LASAYARALFCEAMWEVALIVSALHSPATNASRQSVRLGEPVQRSLETDSEQAEFDRKDRSSLAGLRS
jgi:hypothetical protein